MVVLAVNDRGIAIAGVTLDPLPDIEHRPTGGIHQHTSDRTEPLEVANGDAEGRHDDDIVRCYSAKVEESIFLLAQQGDAHFPQLLVHMRVVDDLSHQEQPPVGKLGSGLVGILDCSINAVTKTELPSEPERQAANLQPVIAALEGFDHRAVVVRGESTGDLALEPETLAEIRLVHGVNVHRYLGTQERWPACWRVHRCRIVAAAEPG